MKWISVDEITDDQMDDDVFNTAGSVLVTNNMDGVNAHGGKTHVWLIDCLIKSSDGDGWIGFIEFDTRIHYITHYAIPFFDADVAIPPRD